MQMCDVYSSCLDRCFMALCVLLTCQLVVQLRVCHLLTVSHGLRLEECEKP